MTPDHPQSRRRRPQVAERAANGGGVESLPTAVRALPLLAVDTREQAPLEFLHFPAVQATLATGDYGLAELPRRFCVERKSMADLVGSLTHERERFNRELDRMASYPFHRLLIIGSHLELNTLLARRKVSAANLAGSLRAIDANRVPVVRVDTPKQAAELVETWAWYVWRDYWRPFRKLDTPEFIRKQAFPF